MIDSEKYNNLNNEIWKPIIEFSGYEVSNFGRVRSIDRFINRRDYKSLITGKLMSIFIDKNGYASVSTSNNKKIIVSKIVAKYFIKNHENKKFIKHKDGDKSNSVNNLEWTNDYCKHLKNESERKLAVDEYFSGKSCEEISLKYNVSRKTIGNWIKEFNREARKNSGWRDFDKIKKVVNEYLNGARTTELAKKYKSTRTIPTWVKEMGFTPILYSEKMGYNKDLKDKIIKLYKEKNLTCLDISKHLNIKEFFVYSVIKTFLRKEGDFNTIKLRGGRGRYYGAKGSIETRFGIIRFDSLYERDRIINNSKDTSINSMSRCKFKIKYNDTLGNEHKYNPDFIIETDKSIIIEEVKRMLMMYNNDLKHKSAINFCTEKGYSFRVITEKEIYEK